MKETTTTRIPGGFFPPPPSPYREDGALDENALASHAAYLMESGADGLYICGGTGDAEKLLPDERRRIASLLLGVLGKAGRPGIVHVGQANLRTAVSLAEHAAENGAVAVAAVPPRGGFDGIVAYYRALTRVGLPVLVYYFPGASGVSIDFDGMARLLDLPGVGGAKVSDWNAFLILQMKRAFPEKTVFTGFDEMLLPGLLLGADGSIGTWGNVFPRVYARVLALCREGRWTEAEPHYARLTEFLRVAWQRNVLLTFEMLMRGRGMWRCFREPAYGDPETTDPALIAQLAEMVTKIEAEP